MPHSISPNHTTRLRNNFYGRKFDQSFAADFENMVYMLRKNSCHCCRDSRLNTNQLSRCCGVQITLRQQHLPDSVNGTSNRTKHRLQVQVSKHRAKSATWLRKSNWPQSAGRRQAKNSVGLNLGHCYNTQGYSPYRSFPAAQYYRVSVSKFLVVALSNSLWRAPSVSGNATWHQQISAYLTGYSE